MNRKLQNTHMIQDQVYPICFVILVFALTYIVGLYTRLVFPYSWPMGAPSAIVMAPPLYLTAIISMLSFIWASARLLAYRSTHPSMLILLLVPIVMSVVTFAYSHVLIQRSEIGREMFEWDLYIVNERIEQTEGSPDWLQRDIIERERLFRELNQ